MAQSQPIPEEHLKAPEKKWYALYTKSRYEKKTAKLLEEQDITVFLPLIKTLRQWSDRKKFVQTPLFNSYIFVETDLKDKQKILETDGVVCFVRIGIKPSVVPVNEINAMKAYTDQKTEELTNYNFNPGQTIRIVRGPMKGLFGEIVQLNSSQKIRVKIEAVNQFLNLTVPASLVEPVIQ